MPSISDCLLFKRSVAVGWFYTEVHHKKRGRKNTTLEDTWDCRPVADNSPDNPGTHFLLRWSLIGLASPWSGCTCARCRWRWRPTPRLRSHRKAQKSAQSTWASPPPPRCWSCSVTNQNREPRVRHRYTMEVCIVIIITHRAPTTIWKVLINIF